MKALFLLCLAFTGCASVAKYPLPSDPAVQHEPTDLAAWINAEAYAIEHGGDVYFVRPTGSMEPTLKGRDYVVVDDSLPWADYVPYKIALYDADWSLDDMMHRIVARYADGLIMSGDANPFSESQYRVTEGKVKGLLTAIWRPAK